MEMDGGGARCPIFGHCHSLSLCFPSPGPHTMSASKMWKGPSFALWSSHETRQTMMKNKHKFFTFWRMYWDVLRLCLRLWWLWPTTVSFRDQRSDQRMCYYDFLDLIIATLLFHMNLCFPQSILSWSFSTPAQPASTVHPNFERRRFFAVRQRWDQASWCRGIDEIITLDHGRWISLDKDLIRLDAWNS